MRVSGAGAASHSGITANGIVKGNIVIGIFGFGPGNGIGISATGTVTGNYVIGSRAVDYDIGRGSTVIGNTAVPGPSPSLGISVSCPSNVTDNTALNGIGLDGAGCNNTNNVAP